MTVYEKKFKLEYYYYIYYNIYNNNTIYTLRFEKLSSVIDLNVTLLHCYNVCTTLEKVEWILP